MDIEKLIDKYMDGLTTVDEEERLARYFRSAQPLPESLRPYRDMFAYFDEGMPTGTLPEFDGTPHERRRTRRARIVALWSGAVAVAAAVAVLFVVTARHTEDTVPPAVAQTCAASDTSEVGTRDTAAVQPVRHRRGIVRRRYDIAPPRAYYAVSGSGGTCCSDGLRKHESGGVAAKAANAVQPDLQATGMAGTDDLQARQRRLDEENRRIELEIRKSIELVDEVRDRLVADGDFVEEDDIY